MNSVLEKLQFVEERMVSLEEQLKLTKIEALEQRTRAEVAETWLKLKNRKIAFMEETEQEIPPPPPSKPTESWDTVMIPDLSEGRTSTESRDAGRSPLRTSFPTIPSPVNRRTSFPSPVNRRTSFPTPVERRTSIPCMSPKRVSLVQQCWPVVEVVKPTSIEVIQEPQVVNAVKGYEDLFLSRKENSLWTKEILREHAINLGIEIYSKKKERLLEEIRVAIENGTVVSNPIYILHLYEKRLDDISLSDVNKETIEEHCKYYGIVTHGKSKNRLWDELRLLIRNK